MNIDNSIGMALFSNGVSNAATGNLNGLGNGQTQSPEGSLFQKLISQMMIVKGQSTGVQSLDSSEGELNINGETGSLLSELLLAGGNLALNRLQNAGTGISDSTAAEEKTTELMPEEIGGSIASLQAFMAGFSNPVMMENRESLDPQKQNVNTSTVPASRIDSVMKAFDGDMGVSVNRESISGIIAPAGGLETTAAFTKEMTAAQQDMTVAGNEKLVSDEGIAVQMKETAHTMTSMIDSKGSATHGNDDLFAVNTEPANGKPERLSDQGFNVTGQGSDHKTAAATSQITEAAAGSIRSDETIGEAGKLKSDLETKVTGLERAVFQTSIHGAAAAREALETNIQRQHVETSQPYSQIRNEILAKLEQHGPTEFKMQLDPADLGLIDIKLKLSEGKLMIDILAANSKTQALLSGQVDKLIASMGLQNVVVESVQVNQQMNSQAQDNNQGQGFSMNAAMDFSQRKQHEQFQQQFLNDGKLAGNFSQQSNETETGNQANHIESMRYNSHRMNYAV